jgi:hypothetical protein
MSHESSRENDRMKMDPAIGIRPARRERLDLEGAKMRYDEAWTEFLLWPDEGGRERVLERFVLYWQRRNGSTVGMEPHFDKLDADCGRAIAEAEEAKGKAGR